MAAIFVAVGRKDSEREERVVRGEEVLNRAVEKAAEMGVEVQKILVGVSPQRMLKQGAQADTIASAILDAAEKYRVHTIVLGGRGESEINPELGSVGQGWEVVERYISAQNTYEYNTEKTKNRAQAPLH